MLCKFDLTKFFFTFLDSEKMFSNEIIFVVEEIAPTVAKDIIEDFFIHFDKKKTKSKSKSKSSAKSSYLLSGMYAIQISI